MSPDSSSSKSNAVPLVDRRPDFLLAMYHELWSNINRHILVLWQSLGTLLGAAALFGLVEKNVISLNAATALFLVLPGWLIATAIDSSTWFNRNIWIIRNIEQQFLLDEDVRNIMFYFRAPLQSGNRAIPHFRIQIALALVLSALVLIYHFVSAQIWQGSVGEFRANPGHLVPYVEALVGGALLMKWRKKRKEEYETLVTKSPGLF